MSRARKLALAATLVGLSTVLCLLLAEVALRAMLREEEANGNYWGPGAFEADPDAGYRHRPGFRGRAFRRGAFDVPVEISELGLRQRNVEEQLRFPRRLLVLGDSFPFGLGVREEEAFPHLLQEPLNRRGIGVVNGAQTGYSLRQTAAFGLRLAEEVRPRAILLSVYLFNDVEDDYYWRRDEGEVLRGYRVSAERPLGMQPFDWLRTRSYLWLQLEGKWSRHRGGVRRNELRRLAESRPEEAVRPTLEALETIVASSRERGIALGAVLIPHPGRPSPFHGRVKGFLEARGVPVLDLPREEFGREQTLEADAHWSPSGHAKAARYLLPFLERLAGEEG